MADGHKLLHSGTLTTITEKRMKYCTKCKTSKPLSEYWKNRSTKDGYQLWCKPCWYELTSSKLSGKSRGKYLRMRRNGNLMRKYGITVDEYDRILSKRGGVCKICSKSSQGISLAVDHDHQTGRIRGILCENCNRGLGMFKDSPMLLAEAIKYLT